MSQSVRRDGGKPDTASWWSWRPAVPAKLADAMVAVAVAAVGGIGSLAAHQGATVPAASAILAAMGLVLYFRRRFAGCVLAAVALLVGGLVAVGSAPDGGFLAVLISSYSAAVYGSRRLALGLATATVAVLLGIGIPNALGASWLRSAVPVRVLLAAGGAWLVGLVVRSQFSARRAQLEVIRERADLLAARQWEETRRATITERLRIARDLHDIVAHHLSVVVIQAQGAQRTIGRDPARAAAAMAQVEQTGRTALEEMRGLLGLLRSGEAADDDNANAASAAVAAVAASADDGASPDRARLAPPGLADIDALGRQMRAAGLPVVIEMTGQPPAVRQDVSVTAYRIVQEALTNVVKHAGPATATVAVCIGDTLDIEVTDNGRGAAAGIAAGIPGAGQGTAGMRERVMMLNGQLTVGPRPGGGFSVHATIPLEGS